MNVKKVIQLRQKAEALGDIFDSLAQRAEKAYEEMPSHEKESERGLDQHWIASQLLDCSAHLYNCELALNNIKTIVEDRS